jgi:hypothetical protein
MSSPASTQKDTNYSVEMYGKSCYWNNVMLIVCLNFTIGREGSWVRHEGAASIIRGGDAAEGHIQARAAREAGGKGTLLYNSDGYG